LWKIEVGEGHAGAAVSNGRVYLLDYDRQKQADALRCLSLADGREIWRYSYPVKVKRNHGMSRTVPTVTDKYVVTLGPKCHVMCLDAKTGEFRWGLDLVNDFGATVPPWYAAQCPLIDNGRAILAPGGRALMMAVDCETGEIVWETPNPRGWSMTHSSIIPLDFAGRRMYVYCASGGVVGVSAEDGRILWDTDAWKINVACVATPVDIGNGRIFLSGGYEAGAMMLQLKQDGERITAEPLFRLATKIFGSEQHTPIFYRDNIYGVRPDGQMVCLDTSGKVLWESGHQHRFPKGYGSWLIAGGKIFVMNGDDGTLSILEATADGFRPLSQARVLQGHDAWGPMAMAAGRLIVRDFTTMVCLDVSRGSGQGNK
jgi:outer membrane protein assembly factor BamB